MTQRKVTPSKAERVARWNVAGFVVGLTLAVAALIAFPLAVSFGVNPYLAWSVIWGFGWVLLCGRLNWSSRR